MSKLYTLDGKLLTETPEIRIGEKIYPVDNRQKTVAKLQSTIGSQNMPYPAYQQLFELVVAAMTGEDPEEAGARFPKEK